MRTDNMTAMEVSEMNNREQLQQRLKHLLIYDLRWQPIATAPKDGRYILLAGPSGYSGTPLRVEVCRWYPEYRPFQPWVTHSNDSFLDGGEAPTHWMSLPPVPEGVK